MQAGLDKMTDGRTSIAYLSSLEALNSIERDPYWPKWNSPWWHMSLLYELGKAQEIPKTAIDKMVKSLKTHYLPIFPIHENEVPAGIDPYRKIACFCAVGNMYQVLFHAGVDVDLELPWMRPWFLQYQLPDGGLNCDEATYKKPNPKSSIVTTIACLEAVLFCTNRSFSKAEIEFLNRGANYLVKQKLFRKFSTGEIIDPDWLEIRFPRFYEYDFFRGYYFLARWKMFSGFAIPKELVQEAENLVAKQMTPNGIELKRYNLFDKRSYNPTKDGNWAWGDASEIELMKSISFSGSICKPLTDKWLEIKNL